MKLLNIIRRAFTSKENGKFQQVLSDVVQQLQDSKANYWSIKPNEYKAFQELLAFSDKEKVGFILFAVKTAHENRKGLTTFSSNDKRFLEAVLATSFLQHLFRTKLNLDEADVSEIADSFLSHKNGAWQGLLGWPLGLFVSQVEKNFRDKVLPDGAKQALIKVKKVMEELKTNYFPKELIKVQGKIDAMLFASENDASAVKPVYFLGEDAFSSHANAMIDALPEENKIPFYKLISLAQSASGAKPSAKYLEQSIGLIKEVGSDRFKKTVVDWFDFVIHLKEKEQQHTNTYQGRVYNYTTYDFLSAVNIDALKGLVWMCSHFHDTLMLQTIATLAERSFKKIPTKGPAAAAVGNACVYTLFKSKGLDGIAHLSRLKLRIKQNSTQTLIEKYLQEAAKQQGISVYEIEDLAVDDYGLTNGSRAFEIEGYKLELKIKGVGEVESSWFKSDGSPQKSVPSAVKEKQKEKWNKIKNIVKQIEVSTSAQRDRIDRMLRSERVMSWEYFAQNYLDHGLMSYLTKSIVWKIERASGAVEVIYNEGAWRQNNHEQFVPTKECRVCLWHPVTAGVNEIKKWREYLIEYKIKQPIKQVFREVYFLTDAEINTRSYSNRMAAHILMQHQFNSLAKTRGWKYSLLGAYDDGRSNEGALLNLPEYGLRAEYWVNEVNMDNAFNDTGIWNYVATDQVRFVSSESGQPVDLIMVPKVPFSEAMRDVDLFVGVSSVGNDPTWNDNGGVPAYRDYWQSYSFGELSEVAKNRKETLERLLPRLKIAGVSSIKDRFLIVRGKLRTYKIHIGSTNILMEPNDQYLCIVPDRSKKAGHENLFLPFEGDTGLSVVLSKAFLLAEDDKISDSTITSQINRK